MGLLKNETAWISAIAMLLMFSLLAQAETFQNVHYLYQPEGKDKGQEIEGKLSIDVATRKIAFIAVRRAAYPSHDALNFELSADSVTDMLYERTSKPRYAAALLVAWPLIFTKEKKHYLTIQYKDSAGVGRYAIFHSDKGNFQQILAATEALTGKKCERTDER